MSDSMAELQPLLRPEDIDITPVYPVIHMIRSDIIHYIDTPLSYDALTAPDLTYTLVQPLVEKYLAIQQEGNLSVVFCCLINRVHFMRDDTVATATLSKSRAHLCEILATRIFRQNAYSMHQLTLVLTTAWPVYNGADPTVLARAREERDDDLEEKVGNAIEMAILGKAKKFIRSSACQKVINAIWSGKWVYQAQSSHSILSDTYKRTPCHFYDPHKAPLMDHYRLKVPSIRAVLEYINFLILFVLFVFAIEFNQRDVINGFELAFMIYALGFTLEKIAAMQEHGIKVYFKGTWNGFDLAFITMFSIYAIFRFYGVHHCKTWASILGIDVLALIACLMFPRLAFVTFKDNLLVLALRAMMVQFMMLMGIAAFCFCGFLYALWTLSRDDAGYGPGLIAWWMLDLWFGLDASGFDKATRFHPVFGPLLMVTYACLSNTLLLTVLVSILSNTFAAVNEDAATEAMFRKAISTIEGVKADSLFFCASCCPQATFYRPDGSTRLTSFPILLAISLYERQSKKAGTVTFYDTMSHVAERVAETLPRSLKRLTFFEGLAGAEADIDAVFEIGEDYDSALDPIDASDPLSIQTQRRLSEGSSRRSQPFPSSPPRAPPPRPRLNSVLNRTMDTQSFSPLAQVFNPVVVEEDGLADVPVNGSVGISYGPATRRRLASTTQRRVPQDPSFLTTNPAVPGKRLRGMGDDSRPPRSRSQDQYQRRQPAKVTEIKNLEDDTGDTESSVVVDRLNDLEKRQERIESLLRQISQQLSPGKS